MNIVSIVSPTVPVYFKARGRPKNKVPITTFNTEKKA